MGGEGKLMRGFTDPELYAQDLSFMTDEDFVRLFKANDENRIRETQRDRLTEDKAQAAGGPAATGVGEG